MASTQRCRSRVTTAEERLVKEHTKQDQLLVVRESTIAGAGDGVFARCRIAADTSLGYYRGAVLDQYPDHNDRDYCYMLEISYRPAWISKERWAQLQHPVYIDGDNVLSKINCCQGDACVQNTTFLSSGRFHTTRTVEEGEELFVDYGEDYWTSR
jgi:uncharacterized protein